MSNNVQRLGETLAARMKNTANAANTVTIELGTIDGSLSLVTDSLRVPIPKGDYMVNLQLTGSFTTSTTTHTHTGGAHSQYEGTGEHTHSDGAHNHRLPAEYRSLQAGDRVLVAWCGNEPVVMAIVVSS